MDLLFADFDVESRVCVFEDDVYLGFSQGTRVERWTDTGSSQSVNVGPFTSAVSSRCRVPFLA